MFLNSFFPRFEATDVNVLLFSINIQKQTDIVSYLHSYHYTFKLTSLVFLRQLYRPQDKMQNAK